MKLPKEGWWRDGELAEFAQVGLGGEDLASEQPARLYRMGIAQRIDDDTLRSVMTFVRSRAVAVETSQRKTDIQPYPINRIFIGGDNSRIGVELRYRERPIYQTISAIHARGKRRQAGSVPFTTTTPKTIRCR